MLHEDVSQAALGGRIPELGAVPSLLGLGGKGTEPSISSPLLETT